MFAVYGDYLQRVEVFGFRVLIPGQSVLGIEAVQHGPGGSNAVPGAARTVGHGFVLYAVIAFAARIGQNHFAVSATATSALIVHEVPPQPVLVGVFRRGIAVFGMVVDRIQAEACRFGGVNGVFHGRFAFFPFVGIVGSRHQGRAVVVLQGGIILLHFLAGIFPAVVEQGRCGIQQHLGFDCLGRQAGGKPELLGIGTYGRQVGCSFVQQVADKVHTVVQRRACFIILGRRLDILHAVDDDDGTVAAYEHIVVIGYQEFHLGFVVSFHVFCELFIYHSVYILHEQVALTQSVEECVPIGNDRIGAGVIAFGERGKSFMLEGRHHLITGHQVER